MLDARVLAKHAFQLDDAGLILDGARVLTGEEEARYGALIARRAAGEPVAYIVGEKEFFGLRFKVAPPVLVPRPDSETLVEAAIAARPADAGLRILDLGTGTGCLLLSLLRVFPNASGVGVDRHPAAAALAAENARALGLADRAAILLADWGAVEGAFDLVISNPPYIRDGDRNTLDRDVRDHEDAGALFAGPDGLAAYRALLAIAPQRLAANGLLLFELGEGQAATVANMARSAFGSARIGTKKDLSGIERTLIIDGQDQNKD